MDHVEPRFGAPAVDPQASRLLVNVAWLLRLRWVAVVGQLLTVLVVAVVLGVPLRIAPLLAVVSFTAATNLGLEWWFRRTPSRQGAVVHSSRILAWLVTVMVLDLFSLTALLYFSGGPENPFTIFYFVNVALAAVLLPQRWAWMLTVTALLCIMGIFVFHHPLQLQPTSLGQRTLLGQPTNLQQQGLLVALTACAVVLVYFVTRVASELRQRERELRVAEKQRARSRRLEALGTLAAGAGHELATPLSTIAVISKELTRHLEDVEAPASVFDDVRLIRSEVDRCRTILDRMSGTLAEGKDEELLVISIEDLVAEVLEGVSDQQRVHVDIQPAAKSSCVRIPVQSVAQAIRGVVQNALDASPLGQPVVVSAGLSDDYVGIRVRDQGPGMSRQTLARAGEPFFTTKDPGKGMGLGLFLTRSVIERLGGTLKLQSTPHQGVTATIQLPMAQQDS